MQLKYDFILEDYYAYNRYVSYEHPEKRNQRILLHICGVLTLLFLLMEFNSDTSYASPVKIVCYILLALALYLEVFYTLPGMKWWIRYNLNKS